MISPADGQLIATHGYAFGRQRAGFTPEVDKGQMTVHLDGVITHYRGAR